MNTQPGLNYNTWKKFYKLNNYYHKDIEKLAKFVVPEEASVLEIGTKGSEILKALPNKDKAGVILNDNLFIHTRNKNPKLKFYKYTDFPKKIKTKYDYIVLSHTISEVDDIQLLLKNLKKVAHEDTRILVIYFNFLWKPIFDFAEHIGLRLPQYKEPNWLSEADVDNLFMLEDFEKLKSGKRFIFPLRIAALSDFINRLLAPMPPFNYLCITNYSIFRIIPKKRNYSVSIIIPARNESGNMKGVIKKIPRLCPHQQIVFVEGNSSDNTYEVIQEEIKKYKGPFKLKLLKQKGKGKGDAVRIGFDNSDNDLFIIFDADLTVDPSELPKFYEAASQNKGDLIMGSRLIYPMESQAMRALNYLGNKFFSTAFTFLLGQRIKDTLCGTKVITKENYLKIAKNRKVFGEFDPFGDFDLIFGASKLNLKILEIPIRYKDRVYGKTNISRFTHGWLLLKMLAFAAKNLKFV